MVTMKPTRGNSSPRGAPPWRQFVWVVRVVGAMHVAWAERRRHAVAVLVEQKQRVVTDGFKVPVTGAAFLHPMHRALARIHVEYDPAGARRDSSLRKHLPVQQPDEILFSRQQLGLEPMQGRRQRRTAVPEFLRPDETKGRVRRHPHRVVEVFVAREPTVDRCRRRSTRVNWVFNPCRESLRCSEMSVARPRRSSNSRASKETGVGGDARSLERDLQETLERELKWLVW